MPKMSKLGKKTLLAAIFTLIGGFAYQSLCYDVSNEEANRSSRPVPIATEISTITGYSKTHDTKKSSHANFAKTASTLHLHSIAATPPVRKGTLIRTWPDGTRIYRQDGLQITVLSSGEILYLPDEI